MFSKLERHIQRGGTRESFRARQQASRAGTARHQQRMLEEAEPQRQKPTIEERIAALEEEIAKLKGPACLS
jgi:polyhydroxyalkanoate synthesis regulator phasin